MLPGAGRLAGRLRIPISIDTYKSRGRARRSRRRAPSIVNDVSGLRHDPALRTRRPDCGARARR